MCFIFTGPVMVAALPKLVFIARILVSLGYLYLK